MYVGRQQQFTKWYPVSSECCTSCFLIILKHRLCWSRKSLRRRDLGGSRAPTSARGLCLSWNNIHTVGMLICIWLFMLSGFLFSFTLSHLHTHPTTHLFKQISPSPEFRLFCQFSSLPISADSPESVCGGNAVKLWRWGAPYSLLRPSQGSGLKARKHSSKNQKATQIFEAGSLDLEDEDPDYITLVFMTHSALARHVHICLLLLPWFPVFVIVVFVFDTYTLKRYFYQQGFSTTLTEPAWRKPRWFPGHSIWRSPCTSHCVVSLCSNQCGGSGSFLVVWFFFYF